MRSIICCWENAVWECTCGVRDEAAARAAGNPNTAAGKPSARAAGIPNASSAGVTTEVGTLNPPMDNPIDGTPVMPPAEGTSLGGADVVSAEVRGASVLDCETSTLDCVVGGVKECVTSAGALEATTECFIDVAVTAGAESETGAVLLLAGRSRGLPCDAITPDEVDTGVAANLLSNTTGNPGVEEGTACETGGTSAEDSLPWEKVAASFGSGELLCGAGQCEDDGFPWDEDEIRCGD